MCAVHRKLCPAGGDGFGCARLVAWQTGWRDKATIKRQYMIIKRAATLAGLIITWPAMAQTELGMAAQWHNRYVSEGRDNLSDGGIMAVDISAQTRGFSSSLWLAKGISEDYEEANLALAYEHAAGPLTWMVALTRLEYLHDHSSDNEMAVAVSSNNLRYITATLEYVYASDADGGWLGLNLSHTFSPGDGNWQWTPWLQQNLDYGYASEAYNGPNNIEAGMDIALAVTEVFSITASAAYSHAQKDVKNDGLGNIGWVSLGLAAAF